MSINWSAAYGIFYNDLGQTVGHEGIEVLGWVAEHPEYSGRLWIEWPDGSRDTEVTEIFIGPDAITIPKTEPLNTQIRASRQHAA